MEEWRAIPDFVGYEVSNLGRVRSYRRTTGLLSPTPKMRKTPLDTSGYPHCRFMDGKRCRTITVAGLVMAAFGPPKPVVPGQRVECLHKNDIKHDNRFENLKWGTHSENEHDKIRNGRCTDQSGEKNGRARLSAVDAFAIRKRRKAGELVRVLAAEYGISSSVVSGIGNGKIWKGVS